MFAYARGSERAPTRGVPLTHRGQQFQSMNKGVQRRVCRRTKSFWTSTMVLNGQLAGKEESRSSRVFNFNPVATKNQRGLFKSILCSYEKRANIYFPYQCQSNGLQYLNCRNTWGSEVSEDQSNSTAFHPRISRTVSNVFRQLPRITNESITVDQRRFLLQSYSSTIMRESGTMEGLLE